MQVTKKDLGKGQIELTVTLSVEEFEPYIQKGAKKLSEEVKIEGFRPGHIPFDVLKNKVGDMPIMEEAAHVAIHKTLEQAIKENVTENAIGQPRVDITKLAPGNPVEYKVILAVLPEIKLGEYKDLKIKKKEVQIKEEEVEKTIEQLKDMKVKEAVVDREVRNDDKVLIDINMYLDKVPVDGGQSKDVAVIVGKNYVIPGFDGKLVKAKKGETLEFELPYPTDHHMRNLAGKMVEFKVVVKEVYAREMPELNDDFAKTFGVKTMAELKENIKKSIEHQKQKEANTEAEKQMLEKIVDKCKFGDIPEMLIDHEGDTMLAEMEQGIAMQGGKFEDYLASIGKSRIQFKLEVMPAAVKRVKVSLLIREISNVEKIEATEAEVEKNVADMKKQYSHDSGMVERLDTNEYKAYAHNALTSQKVIDKLMEWNIV